MNLHPDLSAFIELLHSKNVEYVVVGAHALAYHGVPRYTGDLDILVRASPENAARLEEALDAFGFGDLGLSAKDFLVEEQVVQLGYAPNRIDLLTSLTGVSFDEVWAGRVEGTLGTLPVFFIGKTQFIANKQALGRLKDLADIAAIEGRP